MQKVSSAVPLIAIAAMASGCGLIAGYDFGKYGERDGEGGAGSGISAASNTANSTNASSTSTGMTSPDGGPLIEVLYMGQDSPSKLTVDDAAVYFTTSSPANGKVERVTKDGSIITKLATTEQDPFSIAVDATHAYWLSGGATQRVIKRVTNAGGGTLEVVLEAMAGIGSLAVFGQKLYWTTPSTGEIWTEATSGGSPAPLLTGEDAPSSIAVDASGVYWLNVGNSSMSNGAVKRADPDGTNVQTLASGQKFPLNLALDAGHVYWSTIDGGLASVGKDGKSFFPYRVSGDNPPVSSVAVDGAHVYYIAGQAVLRAPIGSLSTEKVLKDDTFPTDLAIDDKSLYIGVKGGPDAPSTVLKLSK